MQRNMRKRERKAFGHRAWVDLANGSPVIDCLIKNISDAGAMLVFSSPKEVPERLVMNLSEDGRVARTCRVVWNSGSAIGVEFSDRPASGGA